MIRHFDDAYAVESTEGVSMCELCAAKPAVLDGRWCCKGHRFAGLQMMAGCPTPDEIATRAAAIRRGNAGRPRRTPKGLLDA